MQQPEKLLVNIDLSELDTSLMQYAAYLCEQLEISKLVVLHNMLITEPPEELRKHYPDMQEPLEKIVEREIRENTDRFFGQSGVEVEISIFQNKGMHEIVRWVSEQRVDISVIGKKSPSEGQGLYALQYARLTSHAVIMVPAVSSVKINKILASVDFSKNAVNVIRHAHNLAVRLDADVSYLHLYALPPQHFPNVNINTEKYQKEYLRYAQKEFDKWKQKSLGDAETGPCYFRLAERQRVAHEVYLWAIKNQADLIVCGAKGKSDAEVMLLGSVSEKLISTDYYIPMMIVKRKENYGWLESLLN